MLGHLDKQTWSAASPVVSVRARSRSRDFTWSPRREREPRWVALGPPFSTFSRVLIRDTGALAEGLSPPDYKAELDALAKAARSIRAVASLVFEALERKRLRLVRGRGRSRRDRQRSAWRLSAIMARAASWAIDGPDEAVASRMDLRRAQSRRLRFAARCPMELSRCV